MFPGHNMWSWKTPSPTASALLHVKSVVWPGSVSSKLCGYDQLMGQSWHFKNIIEKGKSEKGKEKRTREEDGKVRKRRQIEKEKKISYKEPM